MLTLLELLQAGRYVVATPVGSIPDIYDGHSGAGQIIDPNEPSLIVDTLALATKKVCEDKVDPGQIRSRYTGSFDMGPAHGQWVDALGIRQERVITREL